MRGSDHPTAAVVILTMGLLMLSLAVAVPMGGSSATTESSCTFGMDKDEAAQSCQVPVPAGCTVAAFPGTTRPWTNISKGGATTCQFNEKTTDWKTRITGTCTRCKTDHCSARFAVMFDCSADLPAPALPSPTP